MDLSATKAFAWPYQPFLPSLIQSSLSLFAPRNVDAKARIWGAYLYILKCFYLSSYNKVVVKFNLQQLFSSFTIDLIKILITLDFDFIHVPWVLFLCTADLHYVTFIFLFVSCLLLVLCL